ncbi:MAG TPA: GGDEF domain-containing protein [Rheinheimera sp.]|uniref:GGDEF domain-containing protein n=1 Tax=Rheinheimera sp. TaxID=1869214 RepID=UPI002F95EC56
MFLRSTWFAIALLCSSVLSAYAETSETMLVLQKLEDIRLSDYKGFSSGLSELESSFERFSEEERKYFLLLKGYDKTLAGDYPQALEQIEQLINSESKGIYAFRARVLAVNLYILSRDYLKAFLMLAYIDQQLNLVSDIAAKSQAVANIAMLYNEIERYDISLFYSELLLRSVTDAKTVCRLQVHRLSSLFKLNKMDVFFADIDDAISGCHSVNENIPELIMQREKMLALSSMAKHAKVLDLFSMISDDVTATNYPILIAGIWTVAAKSYFASNKTDLARKYAFEALKQLEGIDVSLAHVELYTLLVELEKQRGDFQSALGFLEQQVLLNKRYSDDKMSQQLAYYQAEGELAVKNQRIALLDKDNELLFLQKNIYEQEVKQNRLIMLALASVLVLATVLAYRGLTGRNRFKKIAEYDQLTGISNRYHFNNQAKVALDYCENNAKPVALILFDLDYFKDINDTHGHAAGDWALRAVVKTCRNFMRNNDVFGRIGGEEFAVVLPGCQTDKAVLLAEICRDAIAGIDTADSGKQFSLSASFGVSGSDNSGYLLKQLLADADSAMYSAKAAGRNQVATFSE